MTFQSYDNKSPYEDVAVIDIPFPEKKYKKLVKLCNLDNDRDLGDHQISQILVNGIYKWLKGEWSLDELSCIGNKFWAERENKADSLANALYAAGESTYYIRRIYRPEGKKHTGSFERWVENFMEYYESHRNQVVK